MKTFRTILYWFTILTLLSLSPLFTAAQTAPASSSAQDQWLPEELRKLETRYMDFMVQIETMETYAPESFPHFKEQEKIKQLVELKEYNERKFKLYIEIFNIGDEQFLPKLIEFLKTNPRLEPQITAKAREYTDPQPKSILQIQRKINVVALQVEQLKEQIERVQYSNRKTKLNEDIRLIDPTNRKSGDIPHEIGLLRAARVDAENDLERAETRLKRLLEDEERQDKKIKEKRKEIDDFKTSTSTLKSSGERIIVGIRNKVREIRLNGLEVPRLYTAKTFVYITQNNIKALNDKIKYIDQEIDALSKKRRQLLLDSAIVGVRVIVIALIIVFLLNKIAQRVSKKVLDKIEKSESLDPHRKQRVQTLSTVTLSFIRIFLWVMAVLWVLGELNIDYGPFLVAAGGISLAIGFGAQSLVKDIVTGFFLLMEEQFALGDSVDIGGKVGTVEKISLRTVKFRALDGTVHTIPNGNISSVSNKTYQWSRAVVKVGVSYDEKPEKVLEALNEICEQFAADENWKDKLVEKPTAQGILSLDESAITFRITVKTHPGDQWSVERELNIRIKNTFDEKGIEIPYNYMNLVDRTDRSKDKT